MLRPSAFGEIRECDALGCGAKLDARNWIRVTIALHGGLIAFDLCARCAGSAPLTQIPLQPRPLERPT